MGAITRVCTSDILDLRFLFDQLAIVGSPMNREQRFQTNIYTQHAPATDMFAPDGR